MKKIFFFASVAIVFGLGFFLVYQNVAAQCINGSCQRPNTPTTTQTTQPIDYGKYKLTYCNGCVTNENDILSDEFLNNTRKLGAQVEEKVGTHIPKLTGLNGKLEASGKEAIEKWLNEQMNKPGMKTPETACVLPQIGQSAKWGDMWGQSGVSKDGGLVDAYGLPATKSESPINTHYRKTRPGFFMTDRDFNIALDVRIRGVDPGILNGADGNMITRSLMTLAKEDAKPKTDGMKEVVVYEPKGNDGEEASKNAAGAYVPENGSDTAAKPNVYQAPNGNNIDAEGKNMLVTKDCQFKKDSEENRKKFGFPSSTNPFGTGGFPGGNGGGGGGGGGGGSLDEMMKLLQAMQNAFKPQGQGNQGQNSNANQPVYCSAEIAEVCGADGNTYGNACIATQENKVQVAYQGACDPNRTPENAYSVAGQLMQSAISSGIPSNLLTGIANSITTLIAQLIQGQLFQLTTIGQ